MSADEAMRYCQKVHDLRQCPVAVGSPQTQSQRDQVARIISVAQKQVAQTVIASSKKLPPQRFTFDVVIEEKMNDDEKSENDQVQTQDVVLGSGYNEGTPRTEIVSPEVVSLEICLGWLGTEQKNPGTGIPSPPNSPEKSIDELEIVFDEPSEQFPPNSPESSTWTPTSCFYIGRISSLNTNNKTPPPSPTNRATTLTPTRSWFGRKESPSPSGSSPSTPTSSWKDSLRGMIRRSNSTETTSTHSTPPSTPKDVDHTT
jgi:hypothetical protein